MKSSIRATSALAITCAFLGLPLLHAMAQAKGDLTQVSQSFDYDPGWESVNNRVECQDCPETVQDFGWSRSDHCGTGLAGEIGGTIWQSRTPAWYGLPLGRPVTFEDPFTVTGRLSVLPLLPGEAAGGAYVGFFNSQRQEWRPWSSMAVRVLYDSEKDVTFGMDYMSGRWNGGGYETDFLIPADGEPHTWSFSFDPDAVPPAEWPDPKLKGYLSSDRQTIEEVLAKAEQAEPGTTREQIEARLQEALSLGLVSYFRRSRGLFWTLNEYQDDIKGEIAFQLDDGPPHIGWMPAAHVDAPAVMDRFGIFNMQIYRRAARFYVSDLAINGEKLDLSRDPGWEESGNRVRFVERDFQRQDYGYSETNWAGKRVGEIGGLFYRAEPIDPIHGYYADDVGSLTLDDPLSVSGNICFTHGGTDAGMYFGYFDKDSLMVEVTDERAGFPRDNMLGVSIDGPTRIGYYFMPVCAPTHALARNKDGLIFLPTRARHRFSFDYAPQANAGIGRVTATVDNETVTLDLTAEQRRQGARFNRFGLVTARSGGKHVVVYLDDLQYTARRSADYVPVFYKQETTFVPYPPGGRRY